jgi:hypothetical protein
MSRTDDAPSPRGESQRGGNADLSIESWQLASKEDDARRGTTQGTFSDAGDRNNAASNFAHRDASGIEVGRDMWSTKDPAEIAATRNFLMAEGTSKDNRFAALAKLYNSNERQFTDNQGRQLTITARDLGDGNRQLMLINSSEGQRSVAVPIMEGIIGADGRPLPASPEGRTRSGERTAPVSPETNPLLDHRLTPEEKLKAAEEMYRRGQRRFTGPDGQQYEINVGRHGSRSEVSIWTRDEQGRARVAMRGIVDSQGNVSQQRDSQGRPVDYVGDWMKRNRANDPILRRDTSERPPTGESDNPDEARERLRRNADRDITDPQQRAEFRQQMEQFEERARRQNMPPEEVARTYNQLSRLMEAQNGAVPKEHRTLAAQGFMRHLADPTNIDQGSHNTCNVTVLAERTLTRTPSRAAEMMTSTLLNGNYTAPDGTVIRIDPQSLVPGVEERTHPPADGARSYATQVLNNVMVNDIVQRRIPPLFYTQGRPESADDTGERLQYADGTYVMETTRDGRVRRKQGPGVVTAEIEQEQGRINGERGTVLAHSDADNGEGLIGFRSPEELGQRLREAQQQGKLPMVILVDADDPIFNGTGTAPGQWHVVSITGYDPATGRVRISNQWGRSNDQEVSLADLYRSTRNRRR